MKILVHQTLPAFCDIAANVATIAATCRSAAGLQVDVVVFPEFFLTGYNLGSALNDVAIVSDGPVIAELCAIAQTTGTAIIVGFPERSGTDLFNTAIAITADGRVAALHRKVFLFGAGEKRQFRAGDDFPVFDLAGHRCGLSICYDIEFPEVTRGLRQRGATVVFVPTANMVPYYDVPTTLVRARALENGLVIVYANLCGVEGAQRYTGQSAVVAPDGNDLCRAGADDAILIVDIAPALSRNSRNPVSNQIDDLYIIQAGR